MTYLVMTARENGGFARAIGATAGIFSRNPGLRPPGIRSTAAHDDLVPLAAAVPHPVPLGLPRALVRGGGVQRVPVVGGLERPVGARDRAEGAGNPGAAHRRRGQDRKSVV